MTPESIRIALSIKGLSHYRCYNHRHVILFCFRYYAILWLSKSVHNEIDYDCVKSVQIGEPILLTMTALRAGDRAQLHIS